MIEDGISNGECCVGTGVSPAIAGPAGLLLTCIYIYPSSTSQIHSLLYAQTSFCYCNLELFAQAHVTHVFCSRSLILGNDPKYK